MNKTVKKVFMLVALLVGIFIAWQLVFNDGGILKTAYNGFAQGVNGLWHKVAGDNATLLAEWGDNAEDNGQAFDMETDAKGGGGGTP